MPGRPRRARRRSLLSVLVLLLALCLAGCGGATGGTAPAPPVAPHKTQEHPEPQQPPGATSLPLIPAAVTEVIDGDTAYMRLRGGRTEKVRFTGVDTPETHHPTIGEEPYGREAAAFTTRSLSGRKVWLELDVQERDHYGRLLAYAWLEPPRDTSETEVRAKMFNARLLTEGYAQVLTVPPNVKYADLFVKLQREARDAKRGLWSLPAPAGQGPYIGNLRSKKFHRPDCEGVAEMSPANRVHFETREEAVRQGYEPCRLCRP
ncbi:MAG: thermonuclease family protein [Desulfotomaculales bacterium]